MCVGVVGFLSFFAGCVMFSVLPSVGLVSSAACRLGSSGFAVRPSARSLGGFVAVAGFRAAASAALFAARVAASLPAACRGCVVRVSGGLSWVSVPVLPASVPAVVRSSGSPLVVVGSPPAVRSAVLSGGVWSVFAAPVPAPVGPSRRWRVAASLALGVLSPPPAPVPAPVAALVSSAAAVGFCGSRLVAPPSSVLAPVAALVPAVPVSVGCVGGLCAAVRARFPSACVFRASSFGSGPGAFVARSVALVGSVAVPGGLWLSFPACACPAGLLPSASSSRCFCGLGSGSWASLALAVGSGVRACLWLPSFLAPPAAWPFVSVGGGWWVSVPASSGPSCQLRLF